MAQGILVMLRSDNGIGRRRYLLPDKRTSGTVLTWNGKFGWMRIDDRDARRYGDRVIFFPDELLEELVVNARASFLLFEDENGLGAADCQSLAGVSGRRQVSRDVPSPDRRQPRSPRAQGSSNAELSRRPMGVRPPNTPRVQGSLSAELTRRPMQEFDRKRQRGVLDDRCLVTTSGHKRRKILCRDE